ncbi:hypothetical protein ABW20_dc0101269 [Dactylellina cionopaga]|nr:hypothetical protein ABW20_dc0101269 [Dactylellina cionopaga]
MPSKDRKRDRKEKKGHEDDCFVSSVFENSSAQDTIKHMEDDLSDIRRRIRKAKNKGVPKDIIIQDVDIAHRISGVYAAAGTAMAGARDTAELYSHSAEALTRLRHIVYEKEQLKAKYKLAMSCENKENERWTDDGRDEEIQQRSNAKPRFDGLNNLSKGPRVPVKKLKATGGSEPLKTLDVVTKITEKSKALEGHTEKAVAKVDDKPTEELKLPKATHRAIEVKVL